MDKQAEIVLKMLRHTAVEFLRMAEEIENNDGSLLISDYSIISAVAYDAICKELKRMGEI